MEHEYDTIKCPAVETSFTYETYKGIYDRGLCREKPCLLGEEGRDIEIRTNDKLPSYVCPFCSGRNYTLDVPNGIKRSEIDPFGLIEQ